MCFFFFFFQNLHTTSLGLFSAETKKYTEFYCLSIRMLYSLVTTISTVLFWMLSTPSGISKECHCVLFNQTTNSLTTTKMVNIQMFWYFIWKASIIWKFHTSGQLPLSPKYDRSDLPWAKFPRRRLVQAPSFCISGLERPCFPEFFCRWDSNTVIKYLHHDEATKYSYCSAPPHRRMHRRYSNVSRAIATQALAAGGWDLKIARSIKRKKTLR